MSPSERTVAPANAALDVELVRYRGTGARSATPARQHYQRIDPTEGKQQLRLDLHHLMALARYCFLDHDGAARVGIASTNTSRGSRGRVLEADTVDASRSPTRHRT